MARTLYDSVTAEDIPGTADLVGGYVDGRYAWSEADWARFPRATKVQIAVFATTNAGQVLDVESGNATPAEAPSWATMRRKADVDPTVYCSASLRPDIEAEFTRQRVAQPHWWLADWTGHPHTLSVTVAVQYANPETSGGHFDLSLVPGNWPGVDDAGTAPGRPPVHGPTVYMVRPGDTLTSIAGTYGITWQSVYAANRSVIGDNPDLIHPGQRLVIPYGTATYMVRSGDTLSAIGTEYGVSWQSIYAANRGTIGANPDLIHPGQVLHIPAPLKAG